ncbi:MAG: aminotransferase class I/II-fold pyridoxal phosphate-dependent enzyme [Chloroflexi bacterium]|nr:aminotransferase class I/II-fold pyridoxal phosphate-dependent enzyme [Chloroflexota bacterium]
MDAWVGKDIFAKAYAYTEVKEAIRAGYYPYFIPLDENEGTEVDYQGHRLIMCGSNNYLGLTTHPKVREAAIEAIRKYGTSNTGSRFLNGTLKLHKQLEEELADFVGKEAALVFSTGYQTNLGTIQAIVNREDFVILDRADHASIVDGAILSQGRIKRFRHNDPADLERVLQGLDPQRGRLVVVDGVYSMDGDIAPLPDLIKVCRKYGARLMVDDAHAMGVLGPQGNGTAAHFGVTDDVDLIMSTFSKSFASLGGFIAGEADVVQYIQHMGRSMIFSASIPAANAAAARAALQIMKEEPERRERLWAIARRVKKELTDMGFNTGTSETPIIPIIIGDQTKTFTVWKRLFEEGVFVNPVLPPAVPSNKTLLRTSYMATHTDAQIDRVLEIYYKVGKETGLI